MDYRQFGRVLLELILLLVGLDIFNAIVPILLYSVCTAEWVPFVIHIHWVGSLIFGSIIYLRMQQNTKLSISIGILSAMIPIYGGIFYLLTSIIMANKNERQAF